MRKFFFLILSAVLLAALALKVIGSDKTRSFADDDVTRILWWVFVGWWWKPIKWLVSSVL